MADQASLRFQRARILQTENLSVAGLSVAGNFEHKGAISCVKDRRRGRELRVNFTRFTARNSYHPQINRYDR